MGDNGPHGTSWHFGSKAEKHVGLLLAAGATPCPTVARGRVGAGERLFVCNITPEHDSIGGTNSAWQSRACPMDHQATHQMPLEAL